MVHNQDSGLGQGGEHNFYNINHYAVPPGRHPSAVPHPQSRWRRFTLRGRHKTSCGMEEIRVLPYLDESDGRAVVDF